jgi:hypothetical protein
LQRQGEEHSGWGNGGASSLKKRLSRNASIAGHASDRATTLTACHCRLRGPGGFVFVIICRSFAVRYCDREPAMVSLTLAIFSHHVHRDRDSKSWTRSMKGFQSSPDHKRDTALATNEHSGVPAKAEVLRAPRNHIPRPNGNPWLMSKPARNA